jgi:excisionase family DNA binding protein
MCAVVTDGVAMSIPSPGRYEEKQVARPLAVSIAEACELIGVGRTTMWALIKTGRVKTVNIGRRRLVIFSSLEMLFSKPEAGA